MTPERTYTIRQAAALTGLPARTLRYYEDIGVVPAVARGESSGHRVYDEADLDLLTWVACLAATGMSVADMRRYVANGAEGVCAADEQIELLRTQQAQLAVEAEMLAVRRRYVDIKIAYWQAIQDGDQARVADLEAQARELADTLKKNPKEPK